MAVISSPLDSRLRLVVQVGTDAQGNPRLATRTYNRIKAEATNEGVYQVASVLVGLQKYPLYSVNRVNEVELEEM